MAVRKAAGLLGGGDNLPETFGYSVKRRLLGPPLVNEQLGEERLSVPLALGVLSPDGISSSAYGTEEILIELLKSGLLIAAFTVLLPITGVVLFVLALVVLSYREVVTVYTRTGGSYVVARDNFGPRVAQIAAVALLIDYTVTVAVQTAAGAAAIVSAFPALSTLHFISAQDVLLIISVAAILIMCYGNLRGIREAGRAFALPTYLFSGSVSLMILVGLAREAFGHLPVIDLATLPPAPDVLRLPRQQDVAADLRRPGPHPAPRLRQRRLVADRHRGGVQRGQRAEAAGGAERPQGAGHPGPHPRLPGRRHLLAGARAARDAVHRRDADRAVPGGEPHLRPRGLARSCSTSSSSRPR